MVEEKQEEFVKRIPDYKGSLEVAAWLKTDKNGKPFLSVRLGNHVNLFKNEPRPVKKEVVKAVPSL